jgi:hypothetical protein
VSLLNLVVHLHLHCHLHLRLRLYLHCHLDLHLLTPSIITSIFIFIFLGCVHAAMDLFKYAYQLYPFLSSGLLRECLTLAVTARKIDMRASPYDVSGVEGCSGVWEGRHVV